MIRKQLYIEVAQERALKQLARRAKVREAEVIRQGLDFVLSQHTSAPLERDAWEAEIRFIRARAAHRARSRERAWTREELSEMRPTRRH